MRGEIGFMSLPLFIVAFGTWKFFRVPNFDELRGEERFCY